ncbi:MAG: YdcH family protein [Pseudomonadota bacterium]|nr:YdcH family protein [Pseudomonadota bacterium]
MQTTHQVALETKHATLDKRIADESHRPLPDAVRLAELKKQKLKIKEEIAHL